MVSASKIVHILVSVSAIQGGGDASLSPDPRLVKGMPKNHAQFVENEFPGLETEIDF